MPVVTFKTITQLSFTLDLEPQLTIAEVKQKIAQEKGEDYAVELQKLIYNGKILEDAATVEAAGIDTNKFVVVMLARKKVPVAEPVAAPAAEPVAAPAPTPAAPAPAPAAPSTDLTADQIESLNTVMGMGYSREQALQALQLGQWDANRAVNLLLSDTDFGAMAAMQQEVGAPDAEMEEAEVAGLEGLMNLPQMEELRNLVRNNPAALPDLMREIATINPALMETIRDNQQAFLGMLTGGGGGAQGGAPAEGGAPAPGEQVIRLTPDEAAAIQRIKSMGLNVPDALIIEAYLACDKNEELALSYIMDNMED